MKPCHHLLSPDMQDTSLFYPGCGTDFQTPIILFHEKIRDFWFVDINSFFLERIRIPVNTRHPDRKVFLDTILGLERWQGPHRNGSCPAPIPPAKRYAFTHEACRTVSGTLIWSKTPYEVRIRTLHFLRETDQRLVRIHLCQGYGYNAFRSIFDDENYRMSVFFYRGDGSGESGSGFYWLSRRLGDVARRLMPGGLIVNDGCNAMREFSPLRSCRPGKRNEAGEKKETLLLPGFHFKQYRFQYAGYVEQWKGRATLIWKVTTAAP